MDTFIAPSRSAQAAPTADGYWVIYRSRSRWSVLPPYKYDYSAEHFDDKDEAERFHGHMVTGEYQGREAVAMVPCMRGLPIGAEIVR